MEFIIFIILQFHRGLIILIIYSDLSFTFLKSTADCPIAYAPIQPFIVVNDTVIKLVISDEVSGDIRIVIKPTVVNTPVKDVPIIIDVNFLLSSLLILIIYIIN